MQKFLITSRKLLFQIGSLLGLVLLSIQIYQTMVGLKNQSISLQSIWPILLAIIVVVGSLFQQVEVWMILMRSSGASLPRSKALYGYMISFLARYIPGTIWGYISRSEWLWQTYQIAYAKSNYISILEIIFAILGCLVTIGLGTIVTDKPFISTWTGYLLILLPVVFWLFLSSKLASYLSKSISSSQQNSAAHSNLSIKNWFVILILLILNWFYYGLGLFFVGLAFGAWDIFQLPKIWMDLTISFSLSWLTGFIVVFIPSGLGLRELVLSSLLIYHFSISGHLAQGISITMRLTTTLAEIICIAIAIVLYRYSPNGVSTKSAE